MFFTNKRINEAYKSIYESTDKIGDKGNIQVSEQKNLEFFDNHNISRNEFNKLDFDIFLNSYKEFDTSFDYEVKLVYPNKLIIHTQDKNGTSIYWEEIHSPKYFSNGDISSYPPEYESNDDLINDLSSSISDVIDMIIEDMKDIGLKISYYNENETDICKDDYDDDDEKNVRSYYKMESVSYFEIIDEDKFLNAYNDLKE